METSKTDLSNTPAGIADLFGDVKSMGGYQLLMKEVFNSDFPLGGSSSPSSMNNLLQQVYSAGKTLTVSRMLAVTFWSFLQLIYRP